MRLHFATILVAILTSSAANASSFVTPLEITTPSSPSIITVSGSSPSIVAADAPDEELNEPSIVRFGGPVLDERKFVTVSPSVIAMVDAPQPVAFENVASIGDEERKKRVGASLPLVIRGGIIGNAFITRAESAPSGDGVSETPKPQQKVSAPKSPSKRPGSPLPEPAPPGDDRVPKSALPPPAPPTGRME